MKKGFVLFMFVLSMVSVHAGGTKEALEPKEKLRTNEEALMLEQDADWTVDESPVADGAKLERVKGRFGFTEGPAADEAGNLYFTDQPNDRIMRLNLDGSLEVFMKPSGRANGMNFGPDGTLYVCADEKTELRALKADASYTVLSASYEGKALNGPNDVVVLKNGNLYISDPYYQRSWWSYTEQKQAVQGVYLLRAGETELQLLDSDLTQPNGICASPDGSTLYVADIGADKTWKYHIQDDGSLRDKELFCSMGSDGMTLDSRGNLYLTGKGVSIFNPSGKKIAHIKVPESWTANVAFGGEDRHTLFITASHGLYKISMKSQGVWIPGK